MIILPPGNRILGEVVSTQINHNKEEKRDAIDVRLCDFDEVSYRVQVEAKDNNIMKVSLALPCYHQIESKGAKDAYESTFSGMAIEPETSFNLTLGVDLTKDHPAALAENLANFKGVVVGGCFDHFFTAVSEGKTPEKFKFDLRSDTTVFFCPRSDRCTVVYQINFNDKVDRVIAKVFMQEFVEVRRKMGAAPPISFGNNPPNELADFGITDNTTGALGYISFAILKSHLTGTKKKNVIKTLCTFRNYIQYHIKCSKSYFHSRMRQRCRDLLKILNRAKVLDPNAEKAKKTVTGKTFARK